MQFTTIVRNHANTLLRACRRLLLALTVFSFVPTAAHAGDFLQALRATYGSNAALRGEQLELLLNQLRFAPVSEQLHQVNRFFNAFRFRADHKQWGHEDYWASPLEFIGRFAGDCEDYAIGKYFALRWLSLASDTMQLSYVRDVNRARFHVVLQVVVKDGAEALILDNVNPYVLPVSQRRDLMKVVGFSENHVSVTAPKGGAEQTFAHSGRWTMRQWDRVTARTKTEPKPSLTSLLAYARSDTSSGM
ncbi:MAG: putative transglutaminase-like cysteine proteinase [Gammaproteobacteria bacterium]|jgi:predicted transglutaminase-like cysteine proteinase